MNTMKPLVKDHPHSVKTGLEWGWSLTRSAILNIVILQGVCRTQSSMSRWSLTRASLMGCFTISPWPTGVRAIITKIRPTTTRNSCTVKYEEGINHARITTVFRRINTLGLEAENELLTTSHLNESRTYTWIPELYVLKIWFRSVE